MLIDKRRSMVQVSRWLGHADPAFRYRVYPQLMGEGICAPLELKIATQSATRSSTGTPQNACEQGPFLQAVSDHMWRGWADMWRAGPATCEGRAGDVEGEAD